MTDDFNLTDEEHEAHHKFLHEVATDLHDFLQERKQRREKWDKIRSTALFTFVGLVTTALFGFLVWLGKIVLLHLGLENIEP